jgi:hypothetical protein
MLEKHKASARAIWTALLLVGSLIFEGGLSSAKAAQRPSNLQIVPTITSLVVSGDQLLASGTATAVIKGKTYTVPFNNVPVNLSLASNQAGAGTCPILDLSLGPIDLNLLGLVVQTSPICLTITANAGGGLLGDLLCRVANLLKGGLSLGQILSELTSTDLNSLLNGIKGLLNGALGRLVQAVISLITAGTHVHTCAILHLKLGPLNLTLLGLNVVLDNCSGGAVTVDITGMTGKGNLLGNLLCELLGGGLLDVGATLQDLINQLLGLLGGM